MCSTRFSQAGAFPRAALGRNSERLGGLASGKGRACCKARRVSATLPAEARRGGGRTLQVCHRLPCCNVQASRNPVSLLHRGGRAEPMSCGGEDGRRGSCSNTRKLTPAHPQGGARPAWAGVRRECPGGRAGTEVFGKGWGFWWSRRKAPGKPSLPWSGTFLCPSGNLISGAYF